MNRFAAAVLTVLALTACETDPAAVHDASLPLDSHVDIPLDFATPEVDPRTGDLQVNLDKMRAGGLDAAFFIVYVAQTARTPGNYMQAEADAMTKFDAIHRMTETYPELIGLVESADDVERLVGEGRLAAAIGIENGYVIGDDLVLLDRYFDLGARYMTLVHNGHNDIADSAQPNAELGDAQAEHGGVSDFGARVIQRMNELGIMVDVSHASKAVALQAMELSAAPVIASHSSVRSLTDHVRNLDDETLLALAEDGGVVQIVAYPGFIGSGEPKTVSDLVDHIEYAVDLIGIEHVGISSDFGGGGGIEGWNDATETPNVTAELVRRGYSASDIERLWSGNLLRVWREAERVAAGP
ncbi:MAG TPA: dipeptidase [Gammaproteobacteria bacterium]|nr:dipeptidase [Gammaproteobacteria bacterium]